MTRFPPGEQGPRFFTVEEANELVATLEIEFGQLARFRAELGPVIEAVGGGDAAVAVLEDDGAPAPGREEAAARLRQLASDISAAVGRVNALGCLVKDIDAGLVDFYAMQEGEAVFLCWQFGEPAVAHWHAVEEGFAGRKPIDGVEVTPPAFVN
ncbi:MAG TPA: DUF2203 domain-containing protein [Anaeromyxobacteraceae bacterium]|nr:DUF2203 domain-containing protein [Anaeromyxobacteraceae bacterium]